MSNDTKESQNLKCTSCGVPWADHMGIIGTCAENIRLQKMLWFVVRRQFDPADFESLTPKTPRPLTEEEQKTWMDILVQLGVVFRDEEKE